MKTSTDITVFKPYVVLIVGQIATRFTQNSFAILLNFVALESTIHFYCTNCSLHILGNIKSDKFERFNPSKKILSRKITTQVEIKRRSLNLCFSNLSSLTK